MRIAFITFEISNIGGITRWRNDLETGLQSLGVETVEVTPEKSDWTIPEADGYIFTHACPRQTKTQGYDRWWQSVYEAVEDDPVYPVFHDPYWEDSYDWILEVQDTIDHIVSVQEVVSESLDTMTLPWTQIRHPLDPSYATFSETKDPVVMSASMFKPWKNLDHLIRQVPEIELDVRVHGDGIEYHYMSGEKRKDEYRNEDGWIWDQAMSQDHFEYLGYSEFEVLLNTYDQARWICDLSRSDTWQGVINYTQLEPMLFGTIPIVYEDMVNPFIEDLVWTIRDPEQIPRIVNDTPDSELRHQRHINRRWVEKHFGAEHIAQQWVDLIESEDPPDDGAQDGLSAFS